jgi:hypothetical protein
LNLHYSFLGFLLHPDWDFFLPTIAEIPGFPFSSTVGGTGLLKTILFNADFGQPFANQDSMRALITTTLVVMLLFSALPSGAQVSIGVRIGPPPPPVVGVAPVRPGPDFVWIDGYWYPAGNHYKWLSGYWTRAPYGGARWVGPRYEGGQYYRGYWEGNRGRIEHDHHWDRHRDRDYRWNRSHEHDHEHH